MMPVFTIPPEHAEWYKNGYDKALEDAMPRIRELETKLVERSEAFAKGTELMAEANGIMDELEKEVEGLKKDCAIAERQYDLSREQVKLLRARIDELKSDDKLQVALRMELLLAAGYRLLAPNFDVDRYTFSGKRAVEDAFGEMILLKNGIMSENEIQQRRGIKGSSCTEK